MSKLPSSLAEKLIGKIQTPLHYERGFLRDIRARLDDLLREAERFESSQLDRALRNTLVVLAMWEIIAIALVAVVAGSAFANQSPDTLQIVLVFGIGIGVVLMGLALVPLRGWLLRKLYERRLRRYRNDYISTLRRATDELIAHGIQLRGDATGPFTRLIESQTEVLDQLRSDLAGHQQALIRIEGGLAELKLD